MLNTALQGKQQIRSTKSFDGKHVDPKSNFQKRNKQFSRENKTVFTEIKTMTIEQLLDKV